MKKLSSVLCVMVLSFGLVGIANSALQTIGTATYLGSDYNLIYEDDSIDGGLVWLDFTSRDDNWQNQVDWASGLGGSLTVNLFDGYTTDIDWGTGWRLPLTQDLMSGYVIGSEMGHLYYVSLGLALGGEVGNTSPFSDLQPHYYFSGTEYAPYPAAAWLFDFNVGYQIYIHKFDYLDALAVRPGQVSAVVPIPSAIWLLGSGLIGLVGVRRKMKEVA